MNRRKFILSSGAAALAMKSAAAATPPASVPGGRLRLGFQVYAVRDMCEKDYPAVLKAVRAMGYEGVETGRFYGRTGVELGAMIRDEGLELLALQLYPSTLAEPELAKTIRLCHDCGCDRINAAWFKGSEENENDWQLLVNVLNHADEVCVKEGIAVGYHNHDHEFRIRFDGKTAWEWMWERFSPQVAQELDLGHCALAGEDPLRWLDRYPRRNPTVHVMPAIANASGLKPGEAGVGSARDRVDWPKAVAMLKRHGSRWLVVKPTARPDSLEDLKSSAAYLRSLGV